MIGLAPARVRQVTGWISVAVIALHFISLGETKPLEGMDVQHDRMVDVFDAAKLLYERVHVVASLHITVVEAERFEQIRLRGAS